jgi:hypothetical protein
VAFKDGARNHVGRWTFDAISNRNGFSIVGYTADDFFRLQDLMDSHADCMRWDFLHACKPAFSNLLFPAGFIQNYHMVCGIGFEVGWRVVEG